VVVDIDGNENAPCRFGEELFYRCGKREADGIGLALGMRRESDEKTGEDGKRICEFR